MRSYSNEAEAHSAEQSQMRSVPKWIDWSFAAASLIYTFVIAIPGIFNAISMAIEHHPSQAQLILNTVFIASNLFLSLSTLVFLAMTVQFNRTSVHSWRKLPILILVAAYLLGCAYDSLAHLVPGQSLPLLVDVLVRLAPGPMAIVNDLKPFLLAALFLWVVVNTVRSLRRQR